MGRVYIANPDANSLIDELKFEVAFDNTIIII